MGIIKTTRQTDRKMNGKQLLFAAGLASAAVASDPFAPNMTKEQMKDIIDVYEIMKEDSSHAYFPNFDLLDLLYFFELFYKEKADIDWNETTTSDVFDVYDKFIEEKFG